MTVTLAGLAFRATSPSLFRQIGYPVSIGYDGRSWRIHIRGIWAAREFATRDEAAQLIADAFHNARNTTAC